MAVETLSGRPPLPKPNPTEKNKAGSKQQSWSDEPDSAEENDGTAGFHRMLLSETALLYVVRGSLEVEVQDQDRIRLGAGETLIAEQSDAESPLSMRFYPVNSKDTDEVKSSGQQSNTEASYDRHDG